MHGIVLPASREKWSQETWNELLLRLVPRDAFVFDSSGKKTIPRTGSPKSKLPWAYVPTLCLFGVYRAPLLPAPYDGTVDRTVLHYSIFIARLPKVLTALSQSCTAPAVLHTVPASETTAEAFTPSPQ